MTFKRLVRFQTERGVHYGDLVSTDSESYEVHELKGSIASGFVRASDNLISVHTVRAFHPFTAFCSQHLAFMSTGEHPNRSMHWSELHAARERSICELSEELLARSKTDVLQLDIPEYPVVFTKPQDALAGPEEAIPICKDAQSMLDYEGELAVIIGKDCKNLPEDFELADVVLGYAASNDVSARNFQLPTASGGQFCYAKSFDKFAPIGPWIASPVVIPDPNKLRYTTKVNGKVVQQTGTDDMIWSVRKIIHHLARGTTLRAGTVILTGTPAGVGYFRKEFLQDGDCVEVEIEGEMKLKNTIKFE